MIYSEYDQAVMLLCAHLPGPKEPKPLTVSEWDSLAQWLLNLQATPKDLLNHEFVVALPDEFGKKGLTKERIEALLARGCALGVTLASWEERGLWVATRASNLFPLSIRRRLGRRSPPLFYVIGNPDLLQASGVGVVGSRDASAESLAWAEAFGSEVAKRGATVVSGGAKGVDEAGMFGALNAGGTAVGYLADNLMRTALSPKYRNFIASGRLALVTAIGPDARFSRGAAMGRNRFIYAASKGVCVVAAGETGGTMEGAKEALKQGWGVVYVCDRPMAGLQTIAELGAVKVPSDPAEACEAILHFGVGATPQPHDSKPMNIAAKNLQVLKRVASQKEVSPKAMFDIARATPDACLSTAGNEEIEPSLF